ncbi:MAG: aminotransferase class IV [Thermoleophilia bacterium]|nr:aminotransferase class IV [Thermoleophilia bacterium]
MIRQGIALHPVEDLRWGRCDIKSTNLLAAVLAKQKARQAGASEALFIGPGDVVREGGSSNVFAVLEGTLRTHPLDRHILGGITRKHVLRLAQVLGIKVKEEAFTLGEIYKAASDGAEIFTASTTMDLLPVTRVGEVVIGGGRPGPLTLRLLDALRAEQARLAGIAEPPPLLLQVGMDS